MLRKCSAMFAAMVALVALFGLMGGRASASTPYLYVNAKLAAPVPTYVWANCYMYQGALTGDFQIGDTSGINSLRGYPTNMTFSAPSKAHLDGVAIFNGQLATFSADFNGNASISYSVIVKGKSVWASGVTATAYDWAGIYMQP